MRWKWSFLIQNHIPAIVSAPFWGAVFLRLSLKRTCLLCVRLHFITTLGQIVACCRHRKADDSPPGLQKQMESGSENWNRTLLPVIIPWQGNETLSQESNQTPKLPFSRGHCLQISRTVLAPSLYVIVFLLLLPLGYPECSNERQSGSIVLIYCMAAWMEPRWNMSVRDEHLRCTEATKCSFRNGYQPDVVYMCSLLWQLSVVFSAAPVTAILSKYYYMQLHCAAAKNKAICRKRCHSRLLILLNHEEGEAIRLHSQLIHLLLTAA